MYIPPGDLYQLARIVSEARLSEAERQRAISEAKGESQTSGFEKLQGILVTIGMALLPLRDSLRSPISEQRSLDIST